MSNFNNPAMVPLFNPARSLIVQFDALGGITVGTIVGTLDPATKKYDYPAQASMLPGAIDAVNATVVFELSVSPSSGTSTAAVAPSGLLVERDDDWTSPWDEELERVLGGEAYPAGVGPLPAGGNARMGVLPRTAFRGVFSGPVLADPGDDPADNPGAQFITLGVARSTTSYILAKTPVKYLSLWVPEKTNATFRATKIDAQGNVSTYGPYTTDHAQRLFIAKKLLKFPKFKLAGSK